MLFAASVRGGRVVPARPPASRARASRLRRRCSCSSPPAPRRPTTRTRSRGPERAVIGTDSTGFGRAGRSVLRGLLLNGSFHCRGRAAREAASRIEPRAPASPARRRAGVRSERAVAARHAGGPAVTARRLDSHKCLGASPPTLAPRRLGASVVAAPTAAAAFRMSLARRLLRLSAARAYASRAQSRRGARQTPVHVLGVAGAARALRRCPSASRRPGAVRWRRAAPR